MYGFDKGNIEIMYKISGLNLTISYNLEAPDQEAKFKNCITDLLIPELDY